MKPKLIIKSIKTIKIIKNNDISPYDIAITCEIKMVSSGNFIKYIENGNINIEKINGDILTGVIEITT